MHDCRRREPPQRLFSASKWAFCFSSKSANTSSPLLFQVQEDPPPDTGISSSVKSVIFLFFFPDFASPLGAGAGRRGGNVLRELLRENTEDPGAATSRYTKYLEWAESEKTKRTEEVLKKENQAGAVRSGHEGVRPRPSN
jgi:hypothetical protein